MQNVPLKTIMDIVQFIKYVPIFNTFKNTNAVIVHPSFKIPSLSALEKVPKMKMIQSVRE